MVDLKEVSPELFKIAEKYGYKIEMFTNDQFDINYETKEYIVTERNLAIEAQKEFEGFFESYVFDPGRSEYLIATLMCNSLIKIIKSKNKAG